MGFLDRLLGNSETETEKDEVLDRLDDLENRTTRLEKILDVEAEETIRLERAEKEAEWGKQGDRRSRRRSSGGDGS